MWGHKKPSKTLCFHGFFKLLMRKMGLDSRLRLGRRQFRRPQDDSRPTRQYYWRLLGSIFNFRRKNKRRFHSESPLIFRAEDGTWTHTPIIGTRSLVLLVCQFRHFRIFNYRRSRITKLSVLPRGKNSDAGDGTWTHTTLLPQAPEACASANSATPAHSLYLANR